MKIRTLLLDDDENSLAAATAALSTYSQIEIVGCFSHSSKLFAYLSENSAHLLFLDIELNEEMGFTVAKTLSQTHPELMIVFLTGHASYAIDGYDFQPVNFLTKPIRPLKLDQTIKEVKRRLTARHEQHSAGLMFNLAQGYRILDVRDICYIERNNRKNYLHTATEVLRIAGYTMHDLEVMLEEHGFFLCHQSVLISLYRGEAVRDVGRQLYEVTLRDCQMPIPVSRHRYEKMLQQLQNIGIPIL